MRLNVKLFIKLIIHFFIVLLVPVIIFAWISKLQTSILVGTTLLSLGIGVILAFFISRDILGPVQQIQGLMRGASAKDLTNRFSGKGSDEISLLGQSYSEMMDALHETFSQLNYIFEATTSSTDQILNISGDQSKWVSEQSSYILEISSTMEELNTSAQMVHQKADHLYKQAEEALTKSKDGQEALKDATEFMNNIREKVKEIANRIMSLSEQAQAIDQIISTVSDIAEKTDILAINAAIEAVKAGEYGKGFGVVAVEIRKLADQSKKASAKIVSRVREIQASTNNSVMAAEEGEKSVDRGVQLIDQAGDIVIDAMKTFQDTVNLGNEIRLASREQSVATSQVAEGTQVISQSVQKMDASFKETVESIRFLSEQAQKVSNLLSTYKI